MNEFQTCRLYLAASFAVAESVWKRVMDPIFGLILAGGAGLAFIFGINLEGAGEMRVAMRLVQVFVALIVIFIGTTEVSRDLATRNVQFFLSKPLGRGGYLLGKFLGVAILGEIILGTYAFCFEAGALLQGGLEMEVFLMMLSQSALQMLALAALLILLSVMLPELAATIFGVAFYMVCYLVFIVPSVVRLLVPDLLQPVFLAVYYPLPNWRHYVWDVEGIAVWHFLLLLLIYSIAYCSVVLAAANYWFRRRDLN
ncbi:MAG: ABC transporter permease subunit [Verrucomicrobia bacterium]|nr:ABC transporter permease subunit [Verrucomicrobiota bacterium]